MQYATQIDKSGKFDPKGKRRIPSIVGTFLFYSRAMEPTILAVLNDIATVQAAPTTNTIKQTRVLMDYMAT